MTDWLTANSKTAYPFADTDAYADALTPVVDGIVSLTDPVIAYLAELNTATERVVVVDESQTTLVDSLDGSYTKTTFGSFDVITVEDDVHRSRCVLTLEAGAAVGFISVGVPFATQAHDYAAEVLHSINGLDQSPVIQLGEDFEVTNDGDTVTISLKEYEDRLDVPTDPNLYTLNNTSPNTDGSFYLEAAENGCHRFDPGELALAISNICKQCCTCAEYYSAYVSLQGVDELLGADIALASEMISRYHTLVSRWHTFVNGSETQTPVNTNTTARGWTGDTDSARAIAMLVRFIPGTFGGAFSVMVTNGFDINLDSITVEVTSNKEMTSHSMNIQAGGRRDTETFGGFPGTAESRIDAHQAVMFSCSLHNTQLVGQTAQLDVQLTAVDANDVIHSLRLTLPAVPFNPSLEMR